MLPTSPTLGNKGAAIPVQAAPSCGPVNAEQDGHLEIRNMYTRAKSSPVSSYVGATRLLAQLNIVFLQ